MRNTAEYEYCGKKVCAKVNLTVALPSWFKSFTLLGSTAAEF